MFDTETRLAERFNKSKPDITVGWYFPNTYQIGMSGLGYQLVWWLFEQDPGVEVKRGFTDIEEPGLVKPDLMGFTVSWELDFINIIELLVKKDPCTLKRQPPRRRSFDLWRRTGTYCQSRTLCRYV